MRFLKLFTERRIWGAIISAFLFIAGTLGYALDWDVEFLTEQMTAIGVALLNLVTIVLLVLSYLFPKKFKK